MVFRTFGNQGALLQRTGKVVKTGLLSYAQIYFSKSPVAGLLFLLATLVVPTHGVSGLIGLVIGNLAAILIGRPKEQITDGYYGFNGLLVGLALGLYFRFTLTFLVLLFLACFITTLVGAALRNISERYLGIPVLSTAFCIVTWLGILAARRFSAVEVTIDPILVSSIGADLFPAGIELYLRTLAAAFFQLSVLSGILIFLGILYFSRWAIILSIIGFSCGYITYIGLGGTPSDLYAKYVGFNFVLSAIATGGTLIVLRPASMLYAALSGAVGAVLSAAFLALLKGYELPILAAPFILTTILFVFVIQIRTAKGRLTMVRWEPGSPEQNLCRTIYRDKRYPDPSVPVVFLPVMGKWTITQGHEGDKTHKGLFSHAFDFEIQGNDERSFKNSGNEPRDYYAYGAPVITPGDGKVVRVVDHLEDNPIGEVDIVNNWGNLIIIWHGEDVFSALCHLQKGSTKVKEGDAVTAGKILAKVGNSGRSPVPHLHFQLQSSQEIGAPTRYGELIHYLEHQNGDSVYMTSGVPETGAAVSSVSPDDDVRRAATLAPGRTWKWTMQRQDRTWNEEWTSEIDHVGARNLLDLKNKAKIPLFVDNRYTTLLDYEGKPGCLLGFFYLGVPRLPYLKEQSIHWKDTPQVTSFLPKAAHLIHDLILPFGGINLVQTESKFASNGTDLKIVTHLSTLSGLARRGNIPDRIETTFTIGVGPVKMSVYSKGREVVKAWVDNEN